MNDLTIKRVTNKLPITCKCKASCSGHFGYGFQIGGVAAMDSEQGVISTGSIGFDTNCGMRLLSTNLTYDEVKPHLKTLVGKFYERVPAGVGS
ncbi:MAG: RtcB family protein, partial [Methanomicrobiales archaeon]|nr:RtcB family protein [Methanomicrobiales archaeon]